jgi:hypothetical protein
MSDPRAEKITQRDCANRLGITPRQVRNLVLKGMPTLGKAGWNVLYPWPECRRWYTNFLRELRERPKAGLGGPQPKYRYEITIVDRGPTKKAATSTRFQGDDPLEFIRVAEPFITSAFRTWVSDVEGGSK